MLSLEDYYKIINDGHPSLKFCEHFDDKSSKWNFTRHSHPYIELMYFMEGKGNITVSGTQLSFSLFDTVVYPANWEHQEETVSERRREIICLWVDLPELKLEAPIQVQDKDNLLNGIFRFIHNEAKREEPNALMLEYGLKLLLMHVLRVRMQASDAGHLTCVLQYIHTYYTSRITLDTLASLEHISKSYLSRLFKQQTGMTVIEYINHLRMESAKRLLVSTDKGITEIAYLVGFESPKYFYRTFKAEFGESPVNFRKSYKNPQ